MFFGEIVEFDGHAVRVKPRVHVRRHVPPDGVVVDVHLAHAAQHLRHVRLDLHCGAGKRSEEAHSDRGRGPASGNMTHDPRTRYRLPLLHCPFQPHRYHRHHHHHAPP